jgi:thiol-disulfide isomerase/thioredoxin
MKHAALAAIAIFVAAGADARQAGEAPQPASPPQAQEAKKAQRPPIYDEGADAKQQIAAALAKAGKENRRVLIQWGANWCGWCHLLHDTFKDDTGVRRKLQYEYDVVLVDIGRFDKNTDLTEKYGAELKGNGVPFLTILDAEGKVLANQETGSLEAKTADGKNGHDAGKIVAFLTEHQAEYLPASQVLDDGLAKARAGNKRVFLHFGAPWCGWCHKLEDWSSRPDIAPILAKDFTDVKIDVDRTVGGKDVLARYNPESKGGIPWFVILDADGKAVITSDGPAGNIGHPVKPEEIDHFIAMMTKSARAMTEADIATLRDSLVEGAKKIEQR